MSDELREPIAEPMQFGDLEDEDGLIEDLGPSEYFPGYYFPRRVYVDDEAELKGRAGIAAKLAKCYQRIERVKERGKMSGSAGGYSYVTADDLYDEARAAMAENNLALIPLMHRYGVRAITRTSTGGENRWMETPFTFLLMDGDSGHSLPIPWIGEAQDAGDKGVAKTVTSAVKYFLRTLFLISTGEDADAANIEKKREETREGNRDTQGGQSPRTTQHDASRPDLSGLDLNTDSGMKEAMKRHITEDQDKALNEMCTKRNLNHDGILVMAWAEGVRTNEALLGFLTKNKDKLPKGEAKE